MLWAENVERLIDCSVILHPLYKLYQQLWMLNMKETSDEQDTISNGSSQIAISRKGKTTQNKTQLAAQLKVWATHWQGYQNYNHQRVDGYHVCSRSGTLRNMQQNLCSCQLTIHNSYPIVSEHKTQNEYPPKKCVAPFIQLGTGFLKYIKDLKDKGWKFSKAWDA